jgi:hypothetical protein
MGAEVAVMDLKTAVNPRLLQENAKLPKAGIATITATRELNGVMLKVNGGGAVQKTLVREAVNRG